MNATPTDEADIETPPESGVGQRLLKAREALNLSRDEVAAGLYLKENIVAALEEDNSDALPGPVFVQGYLRKYARLLGIPEEPLLAAYSQQSAPHKRSRKQGPLAGSPIKPEIRSSHTIVRLITWMIVLGLLALVAIWWQGDMQWPLRLLKDDQSTVTQDAQSGRSFTPELPVPADDSFSDEDEAKEQSIPLALVTTLEAEQASDSAITDDNDSPIEEQEQDAPAVADTHAESSEGEMAATEVNSDSEVAEADASATEEHPSVQEEIELDTTAGEAADTSDEAAAMVEDTAEPETSVTDGSEQTPAPPIDYANSIVVEFSDACWTEIRGANNSYKLLGNMQKGKRYALGGEPPYTFVLGNSQAVTLTIKGQEFDIEAHSKANIARFTLQAEDIPNS